MDKMLKWSSWTRKDYENVFPESLGTPSLSQQATVGLAFEPPGFAAHFYKNLSCRAEPPDPQPRNLLAPGRWFLVIEALFQRVMRPLRGNRYLPLTAPGTIETLIPSYIVKLQLGC